MLSRISLAILLAYVAGPRPAQAEEQGAARRALIVCGHPGDDEHRTRYAETVTKIADGLVEKLGFERDSLTVLFGTKEMLADGKPVPKSAAGPCTREEIRSAVETVRGSLRPQDALWVIVIGHSYFDGRRSWFNIPGPDLHEESFAELFKGIACRELVFWITTPASGFYIRPLSANVADSLRESPRDSRSESPTNAGPRSEATRPGRIIITATEADREINETVFPHVLANVLADPPEGPDFDRDQDGKATLLDLYLLVAEGVAREYAADESLATEHARLEDNGDGRGSEVQADYLPEDLGGRGGSKAPPRAQTADGARAAAVVLPLPTKYTRQDSNLQPSVP